jgi:predicted outer membrane repeat protein
VAGISNVEATNLVLTENASVVYGGGVAVTETATLDWIGGALTDNHCDNGGGAFVGLDATLHVAGDAETFLIDGNTGFIGGAIRASGDLTVTDTTLSNNSATSYGGAVYAFGHVDFLRSDLVNNWSATSGGGIYTLGTATFVDTNISGNQAVSHGGGAFVDGTAEFVGSTLDSNDGGSQGGAVYVYPTGAVDLVDSALTHNSATTGGAVLSKGVVAFDQVSLSDNTATDGSSVALVGESAVFTYTIAPGGNGDPTPNIYCDTSGNTYATTDPYTSCDDVLCYP